MISKITKKLKEHGYENLLNFLSAELSESELNSLLLEVFKNKAELKKASQVLKDYSENRFTKPSSIDPIKNLELELQILKVIPKGGFELVEFSPLAPLGTVSIHKTISQNNIVSGLRRTEVVSDITNVLALEASKRIKENPDLNWINLAASHRLVRAQGYDNPDYTAHFKLIGMASSWLDEGNLINEEKALMKHIRTYVDIFRNVYKIEVNQLLLTLKVISDSTEMTYRRLCNSVETAVEGLEVKTIIETEQAKDYYSLVRFGIQLKSMDYPVVDGGFVNWVSNFTQNKKRKLLISGIGTEQMYHIMEGRRK